MPQTLPDALVRGVGKARASRRPEQEAAKTQRRSAVALAGVPLFEGFSRRHLHHLAKESDVVVFGPGEHVIEEGMLGEALFVLLEGQARVMRKDRRVARLVPGDFFGELSAIDGGPRTASVVAETPLVCVRLFRHTLVSLLRREPLLALKLLQGIARRLREVQKPISA